MPVIQSKIKEITESHNFGAALALLTLITFGVLMAHWLITGLILWLLSFGWPVFAITWGQTFPVSIAWLLINMGSSTKAK